MRKTLKTFVFYVGIDLLGFPMYHRHYVNQFNYSDSQFFREFSKKD